MGSTLGVAAERSGRFKQGSKQWQRKQGMDQEKEKVQEKDHARQEEKVQEKDHARQEEKVQEVDQEEEKVQEKGLPHQEEIEGSPESSPCILHEKKRYQGLYEGMKERCCALEGENETQRQIITRKHEEVRYLQHQIQELKQHHVLTVNALNEKVKELQHSCRDLSLKIEKTEHLHYQQSMADSGSYPDSAATPPLLRAAIDSVKDAITACATELFSRIKKNSLAINCVRMNIDSKETAQINKVALQSFLCHVFFEGFEDPFFSVSDGIPLFVKPASRKAHLFQGYKRCRDSDAKEMLNEETEFIRFFDVKESVLCKKLIKQLFTTDEVQKTEDFVASELRSRNSNFHRQLLRLVKAVWLLHKLVFSFEPRAEIIRVGQGSVLDDEFMEDVAGDDEEEDAEEEIYAERYRRVKKVRFMCVPGFIVRHTIIKARVFCLERSEHDICGQTGDPCPMTLG